MSQHGLVVVRPDSVPAPTAAASDVLDAWLAGRNPNTLRGYHFDLTDFARFLKIAAKDPAAAAVEALLAAGPGQANRIALAYRAHLLGRQLAPATIARRLAALRSLVKLGRAARPHHVDARRRGPADQSLSRHARTRPRGMAAGPGPRQPSSPARAAPMTSGTWQSSVCCMTSASGAGKPSRWTSTMWTSTRGSAVSSRLSARASSSRRSSP